MQPPNNGDKLTRVCDISRQTVINSTPNIQTTPTKPHPPDSIFLLALSRFHLRLMKELISLAMAEGNFTHTYGRMWWTNCERVVACRASSGRSASISSDIGSSAGTSGGVVAIVNLPSSPLLASLPEPCKII